MAEQPQQPSSEEMQQGVAVATAATEAAAAEETPAKARAAAARAAKKAAPASFELTDEHCEMIANGVVAQMEARGAFEAPPATLEPAPSNQPPGVVPPADQGQQPAVQPATPAPPRHRTFAERFRGS